MVTFTKCIWLLLLLASCGGRHAEFSPATGLQSDLEFFQDSKETHGWLELLDGGVIRSSVGPLRWNIDSAHEQWLMRHYKDQDSMWRVEAFLRVLHDQALAAQGEGRVNLTLYVRAESSFSVLAEVVEVGSRIIGNRFSMQLVVDGMICGLRFLPISDSEVAEGAIVGYDTLVLLSPVAVRGGEGLGWRLQSSDSLDTLPEGQSNEFYSSDELENQLKHLPGSILVLFPASEVSSDVKIRDVILVLENWRGPIMIDVWNNPIGQLPTINEVRPDSTDLQR